MVSKGQVQAKHELCIQSKFVRKECDSSGIPRFRNQVFGVAKVAVIGSLGERGRKRT